MDIAEEKIIDAVREARIALNSALDEAHEMGLEILITPFPVGPGPSANPRKTTAPGIAITLKKKLL